MRLAHHNDRIRLLARSGNALVVARDSGADAFAAILHAGRVARLLARRRHVWRESGATAGRAAAHPVPIDERLVADHWTDLLRLAALIRTGMTNAFALPERLSSYPRANIFEQARQPT